VLSTLRLWWNGKPSMHGVGDWLYQRRPRLDPGLEDGTEVIILVALMPRIPPLERGFGENRLARWH